MTNSRLGFCGCAASLSLSPCGIFDRNSSAIAGYISCDDQQMVFKFLSAAQDLAKENSPCKQLVRLFADMITNKIIPCFVPFLLFIYIYLFFLVSHLMPVSMTCFWINKIFHSETIMNQYNDFIYPQLEILPNVNSLLHIT